MSFLNLRINSCILLLAASYLSSAHVYAKTDQDLMSSGQWRDAKTGLIWMRCSIGQQWTGKTCAGEAKPMNGFEALRFTAALKNGSGFAGHTNWRLPNPYELSTIRSCSSGWQSSVSHQVANMDGTIQNIAGEPETIGVPPNNYVPLKCADSSKKPTINLHIFPNTSLVKHNMWWTDHRYGNDDLLYISFHNGVIDKIGGSAWKGHVRLVRQ